MTTWVNLEVIMGKLGGEIGQTEKGKCWYHFCVELKKKKLNSEKQRKKR